MAKCSVRNHVAKSLYSLFVSAPFPLRQQHREGERGRGISRAFDRGAQLPTGSKTFSDPINWELCYQYARALRILSSRSPWAPSFCSVKHPEKAVQKSERTQETERARTVLFQRWFLPKVQLKSCPIQPPTERIPVSDKHVNRHTLRKSRLPFQTDGWMTQD